MNCMKVSIEGRHPLSDSAYREIMAYTQVPACVHHACREAVAKAMLDFAAQVADAVEIGVTDMIASIKGSDEVNWRPAKFRGEEDLDDNS